MLKAAVVGGPSLVFTRKHVAGETRIRSHQYEDARVCRRILGYDANSLYPSTMMKEMPCGPRYVKSYDNPEAYARVFPQFLWMEEWFGFAEVDIKVPEELWPEFEEFPPLFINRGVPDSAVPQHMHDYLQQSGRKRFPEQSKLLGVMSAKKILLYAPLLAWYLNHGLKLTAVYRTIDYEPREIFSWFVNEVANNRRKGDADKDKALLAEVFKLLGNSAYGKFIEAVERHTNTIYTCDEEEVDKSLRSARFKTLEEIGPAYKVELRKSKINIDRPFQVGIVVYQLAKLRMLQFYYEFLDFYLDRRDFELIQMDTDSMYFALSREKLEDAIRPGYEVQFEEEKKRWLAWDKWSNREPGLIQAREGGYPRNRTLQQVLPHKGQCHRSGKGVLQGSQQTAERDASGAFRAGPCGRSGRGGQPRLPNAGRFDVHVRAAQARSERVLRQAMGVAGRYPHGATGVSPVSTQLKVVHPMAYHGTWKKRALGKINQNDKQKPTTLLSRPSGGIYPTRKAKCNHS